MTPPHDEDSYRDYENARGDRDNAQRLHILDIDDQVTRDSDDGDIERHPDRQLAGFPVDLHHRHGLDVDEHEQQVGQHDILLDPHVPDLYATGNHRRQENDTQAGVFDEPGDADSLMPDTAMKIFRCTRHRIANLHSGVSAGLFMLFCQSPCIFNYRQFSGCSSGH